MRNPIIPHDSARVPQRRCRRPAASPTAAATAAGRPRRRTGAGRARCVAALALRPRRTGLARLRGAVAAARVAAAFLPVALPSILALVRALVLACVLALLPALTRGPIATFVQSFDAIADLGLGLACVLPRLLAFALTLLARFLALGSFGPRRRHLGEHELLERFDLGVFEFAIPVGVGLGE